MRRIAKSLWPRDSLRIPWRTFDGSAPRARAGVEMVHYEVPFPSGRKGPPTMLVQCCVCEKIQIDGCWKEAHRASVEDRVRNGYCPQCYDVVIGRAHEKHLGPQTRAA